MKIVVVLPRFPFPIEKGDKLRAYHQIVELSKQHEVYLFCVSHCKVVAEQREALAPYCKDIEVEVLNRLTCGLNMMRNWFASKSLQIGYWSTSRAKRRCKAFVRRVEPDVVYSQMVRTMPLVARCEQPKVMDFQDALSKNVERRMEQSRGLMHYVLHFEFKMLRSSEYNAFKIFDGLTIISETDRDAIPHRNGGTIQIVRNGVDFDRFHPMSETKKEFAVVFCGNMQYTPNVDAARFLVKEVMPLVWKRYPEARVVLAGATPKPSVRKLACERVSVTGSVDDIRAFYASSKVFVAPMRLGSGLQNKLLEAMAMGVPCVTTPLANAALEAQDGKHLLLGNTKEELADHICTLLDHPEAAAAMAEGALTFVKEHFSWDAACRPLERVFSDAITHHKQVLDAHLEDE
ncbi:MAG: glycosyltransferase [Bacteroidales bacterium]|nr:glycosyltransferase [Bacteroidales bacterium]